MERRKLSPVEIDEQIKSFEGWSYREDRLWKRYEFPDFAAALAFVNNIGEIAEAADHHPDIKFGWGYAEVETTTHDRGGVTDFDFAIVKEIDGLPK